MPAASDAAVLLLIDVLALTRREGPVAPDAEQLETVARPYRPPLRSEEHRVVLVEELARHDPPAVVGITRQFDDAIDGRLELLVGKIRDRCEVTEAEANRQVDEFLRGDRSPARRDDEAGGLAAS